MWKISEILNIISPVMELFAFILLDKGAKIEISTINKTLGVWTDNNPFDDKLKNKINMYYRIGYKFIYLGCILWILSGILSHYNL